MKNYKKYKDIFIKKLEIKPSKFKESIKYNDIPEWDSIGHMGLMSALEEAFNITLKTDDIVDFRKKKKGIKILKKYKINLEK